MCLLFRVPALIPDNGEKTIELTLTNATLIAGGFRGFKHSQNFNYFLYLELIAKVLLNFPHLQTYLKGLG